MRDAFDKYSRVEPSFDGLVIECFFLMGVNVRVNELFEPRLSKRLLALSFDSRLSCGLASFNVGLALGMVMHNSLSGVFIVTLALLLVLQLLLLVKLQLLVLVVVLVLDVLLLLVDGLPLVTLVDVATVVGCGNTHTLGLFVLLLLLNDVVSVVSLSNESSSKGGGKCGTLTGCCCPMDAAADSRK